MRPGVPRLRVAVVDDDTLIREGVALVLTDFDVVSATADVTSFLNSGLDPSMVDVVILDLRLSGPLENALRVGAGQHEPRGRDAEPIRAGERAEPPAAVTLQGRAAVAALAGAGYPVLIYTNDRRPVVLAACLAAGARALVHKTESLQTLQTAVEAVAAGRLRMNAEVAGVAEVLLHRGRLPALPPRQVQVLQGRARGETFASIARRLNLSERTVESYMRDVTTKFSEYLSDHSAADLESDLGLASDDLLI